MKKTFRLWGMAMVAVLLSAGFAACDNDDDDDYFNPVGFDRIDDALLGTWQYTSSGNGWSDTETITFYSDGTYYETDVETDGRGTESSWEKGRWNTNVTSNQVKFTITDSSDRSDIGDVDVESYVVSADVLTLDRKNYTRIVE